MAIFIFQSAEYMTTDTLFIIGLMMVVSMTFCYVIAKITNDSQYAQYIFYTNRSTWYS